MLGMTKLSAPETEGNLEENHFYQKLGVCGFVNSRLLA